MPFLCVNEGPQFIGLHKLRTNSTHALVEEGSAFIANREEQGKNRSLVGSS